MGIYFGTDGVRGIANRDLTPELAFKIGRSAALHLGPEDGRYRFLVGRDTRISGDMLESALIAGIASAGGDALVAGVVPTPAVAFLVKSYGADAGVVISASHNPVPDNGIKLFDSRGFKLKDEIEDEIEGMLYEDGPRPVGPDVGRIIHLTDAEDRYIDHCAWAVPVDLHGMSIAVDCANGAAYRTTPMTLERLGAKVTTICSEPNGVNINEGCGSTHTGRLSGFMRENPGFDLGISHDGDADRVMLLDRKGNVLDGDFVMAVCAAYMKERGELNDDTVVVTVMTNLGFHLAMRGLGIKVRVTGVGDRYVVHEMREHGLNLGGEQSGHIIFSEFNSTGDGLITALKALQAVVDSGRDIAELASIMKRLPQTLVNVEVKQKNYEDYPQLMDAIHESEQRLGETGRVLVRPSGTEPKLRVMIEAKDQETADREAEVIVGIVRQEMGA